MNFAFLLPLLWYGDTSLISVEQLDTDTGVGDHCDTRRSPKGCITLLNGGETLGLVQVGSQAIKSQNTTKLSAKDADGHARYAQHARTEVVKHFAIVQTASQTAAAMKGVQDFNDGAIVFLSMLFVLVLYLVAGAQLGFGSEESVDSQLQNFYQRTTSWVMPRMEALQELLPCISSNLVGPTADMPLLVPVKALEEREKCQRMLSNLKGWGSPALPENVAWQFDITSICGQKVLAVQQVKLQDGQLGPIQVLGHRGSGRGKCLGSIDRKLQLVSGVGEDFGRLVRKQSGAYELKESATGRHRWLVQANMHFPGHEYFTVTWRPRRRLLATLNRGQGGHADYMKVMPTPGVDVVLVILCCVGLFVFRIDDQVEGQSMEEDPEAAGSGFAGNLLQNADEIGRAHV